MEMKNGYSVYEHDRLEAADSMRIERKVYFEEKTADISGLTALPLEQLRALREEHAAAEQAAFEALSEMAAHRRTFGVRSLLRRGGALCQYFFDFFRGFGKLPNKQNPRPARQRRNGDLRKWVPASYACYSSF